MQSILGTTTIGVKPNVSNVPVSNRLIILNRILIRILTRNQRVLNLLPLIPLTRIIQPIPLIQLIPLILRTQNVMLALKPLLKQIQNQVLRAQDQIHRLS